jgi:prepilin-type N-terminal cleavage/methylation domain-containing protein
MLLRSKKSGFSLVELVIVVVIIGVIAAIAVPRISRGAKGAGDSALRGSLAGLRNAVDMYAAEHGGTFPGNTPGTSTCDETLLANQLTQKSNFSGTVGTGAGFDFGPYLRRAFPPAPVGPEAGKAAGVLMDPVNSPPTAEVSPTAGKGWVYNCLTGELVVNTQTTDASGNRYDQKY